MSHVTTVWTYYVGIIHSLHWLTFHSFILCFQWESVIWKKNCCPTRTVNMLANQTVTRHSKSGTKVFHVRVHIKLPKNHHF